MNRVDLNWILQSRVDGSVKPSRLKAIWALCIMYFDFIQCMTIVTRALGCKFPYILYPFYYISSFSSFYEWYRCIDFYTHTCDLFWTNIQSYQISRLKYANDFLFAKWIRLNLFRLLFYKATFNQDGKQAD